MQCSKHYYDQLHCNSWIEEVTAANYSGTVRVFFSFFLFFDIFIQ